jgi:hypothetical protein
VTPATDAVPETGRIFGIGLSRTGTTSLTKALTLLGISAQHYPNDPRTQAELKRGCYRLSVLETVQALTDIPVAPFYAQLDREYPGSKFVLTTRETDSWLGSVENHFRMYLDTRRDAFDDFVLACVYGSLAFDRERFRYVKELHEENARRYFGDRSGQLLILDPAEGNSWEPLCRFLGLPVPSEPFPHENPARRKPARPKRPKTRLQRLLGR